MIGDVKYNRFVWAGSLVLLSAAFYFVANA